MALVLPQASTARQLRVVTNAHEFPDVLSLPTWFTVAPLHVSLAVGAVNAGIVVPHSKVASLPALPIVGPLVSTLVLLWVTVPLVLLQASTACQVLVRVYEPPHPAVELSLSSTTEELLHVSEEVGSVNTGIAGHSTVPSAGWLIVGLVVSTTMMV